MDPRSVSMLGRNGKSPTLRNLANITKRQLILKILHDLSILYHHSQGIRFLASCRICCVRRPLNLFLWQAALCSQTGTDGIPEDSAPVQVGKFLGLYKDNGKENGNYYNGIYRGYRDYIGV